MDDVNAIVFFLGMMSGGFMASIFLILFMINRERECRMGRKNRRRRKDTEQAIQSLQKELLQNRGDYHLCVYCGRRLYSGQWHWMYDEFGQLVHKCNDERACQKNRRPEWEDSFRKAMRM